MKKYMLFLVVAFVAMFESLAHATIWTDAVTAVGTMQTGLELLLAAALLIVIAFGGWKLIRKAIYSVCGR